MSRNLKKLLEDIYAGHARGNGAQTALRNHKKEIAVSAQQSLASWAPNRNGSERGPAAFQVLDFFSGCGGMSLGFASLSLHVPFFEIVGGCDIDSDAAATFELNFGAPCPTVDVTSLIEESALQAFLKRLDKYDPNRPLVVVGCAPCQGFTSHRKKKWDEEDKRNSLVGVFANIAIGLNPECIVMENVPELLSRKYWDYFEEARSTFRKAGYIVKQAIYNSAGFGVPQERFRAVVLAMKRAFLMMEPLLVPSKYLTVREAIGHLQPVRPGKAPPEDPMHRSAGHRESTIATIRAVPKDGGSRPPGVGPKCLDEIRGFYDVYGRLYWDRPAITITHYARNPASGRYVHPEQDRGLTMREVALLQSFPTGFEFIGSFDSIFKQIGEAVPPKMACGVASTVLVELLSSAPITRQEQLDAISGVHHVMEPVSNSYSSVIAGLKMQRERA